MTYKFTCREDGVTETRGAADMDTAKELAEDWVREGEWGDDGAVVGVTVTELLPSGHDGDEEYVEVEIEPNHEAKIKEAACGSDICGTDPDDHDWTGDGEGGLKENPGVYSRGGTVMTFDSHCRRCGLHRHERTTGAQRNPGDHDTVEYEMLDDETIAKHRKNGDMDEEENADL